MVVKLSNQSIKFLEKFNKKIAGPEQRFIMGLSAISSQPFIDYFLGSKDEKTRKTSVCKTIAKIIVGTATGIFVRGLAIKHSDKLLKTEYFKKNFSKILANNEQKLLLQKNTGDIIALGICLITNFLIDAPLTKLSTNYLVKKFVNKERKE